MLLVKFILAMLPIIGLIAALSGRKMAGHKAWAAVHLQSDAADRSDGAGEKNADGSVAR